MPWQQHWVEAPKNLNLSVFKELPFGLVREEKDLLYPFERAGQPTQGGYVRSTHYYCDRDCKGWIEGFPEEYEVNTLAPYQLAGRQGTEWYCIRCGKQIAFWGVVS